MDAALALLYVVMAGVNYGWQPAGDADDGYEYIVQVEPELLGAMQRGNAAPIESNVPAEVAPIRKVRIVVGRAVLPRETVGAVSRTAYFAGQDAWTPDRYGPVEPASTSGERYPPPSLPSSSRVAPPPSVIDRAQTAVTETTDTLRDGMEAGVQAANEQFSRGREELLDATRAAGQEFGQELQAWTNDPARELQEAGNNVRVATERTLGTSNSRLQQVTNPFATTSPTTTTTTSAATRGNVAPPPWEDSAAQPAPRWSDASAAATEASASQSVAPTRTATRNAAAAWTSIGTTVAAPPLVVPSLSTTARRSDTRPIAASQAANDGPQFPEESLPRREPIHSPLTDPAQQTASRGSADDWSTNWNSGPSTPQVSINRTGTLRPDANADRSSDLVAVEPARNNQERPSEMPPANRFEDVWDSSASWAQPGQSATAIETSPNGNANLPTTASQPGPANNIESANAGTNGAPPAVVPPGGTQSQAKVQRGDEPPWLPLLLVSLSLMGSLSANLFLGWSYMDARQKYRTLVRKTADKFRRAAA